MDWSKFKNNLTELDGFTLAAGQLSSKAPDLVKKELLEKKSKEYNELVRKYDIILNDMTMFPIPSNQRSKGLIYYSEYTKEGYQVVFVSLCNRPVPVVSMSEGTVYLVAQDVTVITKHGICIKYSGIYDYPKELSPKSEIQSGSFMGYADKLKIIMNINPYWIIKRLEKQQINEGRINHDKAKPIA